MGEALDIVTHCTALLCTGGEVAKGEICGEARDEEPAKETQGEEDETNVFEGAVHTRTHTARA
jgi:hypothetical protein